MTRDRDDSGSGRAAPDFGGFSDVDGARDPGVYADYLDDIGGLPAVREWKERSFAALRPRRGARLVDIGCGTGADAIELARRVAPGGLVIGVDASETMVAEGRRRAEGRAEPVEFRVGDALRLELGDASVDGCRAERVLQHLDDPERALAEMGRVTRPGGRVVVAEPDWGTLAVDPGEPSTVRAVADAAAAGVRGGYLGRRLRRMLADAGFADLEVHARALLLTGLAPADAVLGLRAAAKRARESGALPPGEESRWRAELESADARGAVLAAMTAFMAAGRRV